MPVNLVNSTIWRWAKTDKNDQIIVQSFRDGKKKKPKPKTKNKKKLKASKQTPTRCFLKTDEAESQM